jgi:glycosyltransferase involved in cell wall biosynthesis
MSGVRKASVIIPARNEEAMVAKVVAAVRAQVVDVEVEVLVVDDGSTDHTVQRAESAGARVLRLQPREGGNPARARNSGAVAAQGDVLVFLDCDCVPRPGWLARLLSPLAKYPIVGGSLELPDGLPTMARMDYFCGWYHVHSHRPAGCVDHHPPGNLAVRRECFERTVGFVDRQPIAYAHEELAWQAQSRRQGARIWFAPDAVVEHYNRPGFANLLARNYRWGYSAIAAKSETSLARFASLYRAPVVLVLAAPFLAFLTAPYVVAEWLRARRPEPLLLAPVVFLARCAHALGMMVGGTRWLRARARGESLTRRPRWE